MHKVRLRKVYGSISITLKGRLLMNRRTFIKVSAAAAAVPSIVPSSIFGQNAPGSRITIGCIGVGRMGMGDMASVIGFKEVRVVAVCDPDSKRAQDAKDAVDKRYDNKDCRVYGDFRELTARDDIDAVMIVTPDHWHAVQGVIAAKAGKDMFLQKPLGLTISEGRILSDTVRKYGRVVQIGSQQRSDSRFRFACELVRNGRIGKLQAVEVGLSTDPGCDPQPVMPVPENLDYDMWLGPAPWAPYTEKRVHPQNDLGRPGWLRISDYGAGMITGWGSHHLDIAHWGMGMENSGPLEIQGTAEFPKTGLWDVHGKFNIDYVYPGGIPLNCSSSHENGVKFIGPDGWVFVTRGKIDANPKSLLKEVIGSNELHLYESADHKADWIKCMRTRREPIAPIENGHRSCTACLLGDIAMRTGRKLKWDPVTERFTNDEMANRMLARAIRAPWTI